MAVRSAALTAICALLVSISTHPSRANAQSPAPLAAPSIELWAAGSGGPIVRLADGSLIVAGSFTDVQDPVSQIAFGRRALVKFQPNGALDPVWEPIPVQQSGTVGHLVLGPSNTLYVAGNFSQIGGQARSGLAKISTIGTGAADATWNPAPDGGISGLALRPDGALLVAGSFNTIGGLARSGLAKIASSGTGAADAGWNVSISSVGALAVDAGNSTYVGGSFSTVAGQARRGLARLDSAGVLDPSWNPGTQVNTDIGQIVLHDGAVFVRGFFDSIGGQARRRLAKLSTSGAGLADANWNPSPTGQFGATFVDRIAAASGSQLYVAGAFTSIGSLARAGLARVSTTGTGQADPAFTSTLTSCGGCVRDIVPEPSGALLVSGFSSEAQGQPALGLARLNASGAALAAPYLQVAGSVTVALAAPDGSTYVAGSFARADAFSRVGLLKLGPARTVDPNWNPRPDSDVLQLALDSTGKVLVRGNFSTIGGQSRAGLARLSATGAGAADAWNPAPGPAMTAMAAGAGGAVFVAGAFSQIGGLARAGLAKIDASGAVDPVWNPNPDGFPNALAVNPFDGFLYVSGHLFSIGGQANNGFAKLSPTGTGAADPNWNPGPYTRVMRFDGNGKVYVGGAFNTIGGQTRNGLARLSTTGTGAADAWNPNLVPMAGFFFPQVEAIALDPIGRVLVGGHFTSAGGATRVGLARLAAADAVADATWNPAPQGLVENDSAVLALAMHAGGTVVAGGAFRTIGGQPRRALAALPTVAIFSDGFE